MRIYEPFGFSIEKAQTLIEMVLKAVDEFKEVNKLQKDDPQEPPSELYAQWKETKGNRIEISNKEYEVLERFVVDEYWFGAPGLSNTIFRMPLKSFFTGDPLQMFRDRVPFGFILRPTTSSDEIYIVIRGTQTKPEWWNNLAFKPGEDDFLKIGNVHSGFHHIYTKENEGDRLDKADDLPSMMEVIEKTLTKEVDLSRTKVYIAGHSLGAALATLAAAHVKTLNVLSEPPTLYTFASPRVGDRDFSQYFENHLKHVYRVINSEDIISAVPLASARLLPVNDIEEIVESIRGITDILSNSILNSLSILPNLDFHHIGQVIPFTIHKASILENHIAATYKEALNVV